MSPLIDINGEHSAITVILNAMKKVVSKIFQDSEVDLLRVGQIYDFLYIYADHCHYEKEEKCIFPVLLETNYPSTVKTINSLIHEHNIARNLIKEIGINLKAITDGNHASIRDLALSMKSYIALEEHHMKKEDEIVMPLFDRLFDIRKSVKMATELKAIQDENVSRDKNLEYFRLIRILYFDSITNYINDHF